LHGNPLKKGLVMTVQLINLIVEELKKELGDRHFFTIDDLYILGVFGTKYAARMALKNGKLAYVKVSPRRSVIPRAALLEYLRNNVSIPN
jgi:hypothetical protein